MAVLTPGRIYLADQRGLKENTVLRQLSTLNYSGYQHDSRAPFGNLGVFNDTMLAAGKSVLVGGNKASYIILIPVTGQLTFKNAYNDAVTIDVGNVYVSHLPEGGFFELINPYDGDWINFLHIQIMAHENVIGSVSACYNFDLVNQPDTLIPIIKMDSGLPFLVNMGMFAGRKEALYELADTTANIFAFVIAGAFEMQGRLLHQRDALALWSSNSADIEALSNNAVILLLEF